MAGKVIYSVEARRKLTRLLGNFAPDIAHAHCIYHHISPSVLPLLKQRGIPTVLTAHDLKLACPAYRMVQWQACMRSLQARQSVACGLASLHSRIYRAERLDCGRICNPQAPGSLPQQSGPGRGPESVLSHQARRVGMAGGTHHLHSRTS